MKSRRRRFRASPRRLQLGKRYEKRLTGGKRDAEKVRRKVRKQRQNKTNPLKVRRRLLLLQRPPFPFEK
ncbi:MAG: hypothetical protein RSJ41_08420 [Clostridia bacterium]